MQSDRFHGLQSLGYDLSGCRRLGRCRDRKVRSVSRHEDGEDRNDVGEGGMATARTGNHWQLLYSQAGAGQHRHSLALVQVQASVEGECGDGL